MPCRLSLATLLIGATLGAMVPACRAEVQGDLGRHLDCRPEADPPAER